jgi:NAD(P)-dependent dehydrogenase (short-subunit alcohol dehydrogenase family)
MGFYLSCIAGKITAKRSLSFVRLSLAPTAGRLVMPNAAPFALITGAGSGIGEACVKRLSEMGWRVFAGVLDESQRAHVQETRSERVTPLLLDITRADAIAAAAETIAAEVGQQGLAGLVNNAGIGVIGPVELVPMDRLRHQLEVNLFGHVAVTQAFLPLLRKATGRIVNISSLAGRLSIPLLSPYSISKFGIEAMSDALRQELRPWKMHVACIEPALIDTPILASTDAAGDAAFAALSEQGRTHYASFFNRLKSANRMNAAAQPPDVVARAVAHALTARRPKTRYVVGGMRWQFLLLSKLPDRLRDWVIAARFGQ